MSLPYVLIIVTYGRFILYVTYRRRPFGDRTNRRRDVIMTKSVDTDSASDVLHRLTSFSAVIGRSVRSLIAAVKQARLHCRPGVFVSF